MKSVKNIVCVNTGTKYSKDYVNILYNMVSRNISGDFSFYVITDQKDLYTRPIKPIVIENAEQSWWDKFHLFAPNTLPRDEYLYLDLDVVIVDNIDKLFNRAGFSIIRDFIRPDQGLLGNKEYNSSVMYFKPKECIGIWEWFKNNEEHWRSYQDQIHFFGDQNVISEYLNHYEYYCNPFPDEWIWSYKKGVERGKTAGDRSRMFGDTIPPEGKICVFHGKPNPTEVDTDWVKENYR
ncbi:MAG: hypothetical protein N0C84_01330 [Candidatus Thiodiazotropha taylori]|uniref:Glycosyltransferase n=1 Tax=Candidatus Thiodiazotropha taylori TaxID=2792791 RepID=A0A9E4K9J1_9GAMM|nr:hypothetical protein [Candidatus Thiodiazotropha taylori]MCW4255089.1 hypothetical protein [Candidatus Thiodiazotropha taylori]